jgi:hypothetical protein
MITEKRPGDPAPSPQITAKEPHKYNNPCSAGIGQTFAARSKALIAKRIPVFPCALDKRPLTKRGFKDASLDADLIAEWSGRWPDALVGVPTGKASGLFVLDVDVRGDRDGFLTLQQKSWELPRTRTHHTPSGGAHFLFKYPEDVTLTISAGKLGTGLDTRGEGGYIIWWPAHGCEVEHPDTLAEVPDWLLEELRASTAASTSKLNGEPGLIAEGARNDTLFRLGAALRAKGLAAEAIEAALLVENAAKCVPPLPEDEVRAIARSATRYPAGGIGNDVDDEELIRHLAELPSIEYDRVRKTAAKRLGIRPSTLDALVANERSGKYDDLGLSDIEPWSSPVDPAELLSDIANTVRRYIVCQAETADAVALWVAMTWLIDVVQVAPLAVIAAPEKRCGKSQLLTLIGKLSYRPLAASNITPAALFRTIETWHPTLLIDETDSFLKDNEELRGIINAGHTRDSAYVVRVVGEDLRPARFSVWGAKALAGIGHLADTLMDRAILLELRRKLPHERVERLRHADPGLFEELASKLARFADDYREQVRHARPELPESLNDRAQDNWEPLFAIADVAGGDWPARARQTALKLSGTESAVMSTGTQLLADIREVFETRGVDRIATWRLVEELCADSERPWSTYNRGKPITSRQVAKFLGNYGIASTTIRAGSEVLRGYRRDAFEEAFARYLPADPPSGNVTTLQGRKFKDFGVTDAGPVTVTSVTRTPTHVTDVTQRNSYDFETVTSKPLENRACNTVTDPAGGSGEEIFEFF